MSRPQSSNVLRPGGALSIVALLVAVGPLGAEMISYAHDRMMVAIDFGCTERVRGGAEAVAADDSFPQCHLQYRKPFGLRSTRAWRCGLPRAWLCLDAGTLLLYLLLGLPLLGLLSAAAADPGQEPRHRSRLRRVLLGVAWGAFLVAVASLVFPPDWAKLAAGPAAAAERTVTNWHDLLRGAAAVQLAALLVVGAQILPELGRRRRRG